MPSRTETAADGVEQLAESLAAAKTVSEITAMMDDLIAEAEKQLAFTAELFARAGFPPSVRHGVINQLDVSEDDRQVLCSIVRDSVNEISRQAREDARAAMPRLGRSGNDPAKARRPRRMRLAV